MAVRVRGRVIAVEPLLDGTFSVTLGPGPDVFWYSTYEPTKLGAELEVLADSAVPTTLMRKDKPVTLTRLEGVEARVIPEPYPTRVVSPAWLERVRHQMRPERALWAYQEIGAAWMSEQLARGRGLILGDDTGTGKSVQMVAALSATGLFPAIIVCPSAIKVNWVRELGHSRRPLSIFIVRKKRGVIPNGADVVIVNYELLAAREQDLGRFGARVIVFDEAQCLKESQPTMWHRAAVATRLAHFIGRCALLTGTPVENKTGDFWRLLHIVDKKNWPSNKAFRARYCQALGEDERNAMQRPERSIVTQYGGRVERLDELQARIQPVFLRRMKTDVLKDLPPKSRRSLLVELEPGDQAEYDVAERDFAAWVATRENTIVQQRANRALALAKLTKMRQIAAMGKMCRAVPEYLRDWFDRVDVEPLVVFGHHQRVLDEVHRFSLVVLGLRVARLLGGAEAEKKQRAIDDFNDGRADIFVAPILSAGVGLNLQGRCSDVLFVERLWTPSRMEQAEARLHRAGQQRPVTATYIDAAGTVDEHIAAVLDSKRHIITPVVDDRDVGDDEGFAVSEAVVDRFAGVSTCKASSCLLDVV